MVGLVGGVQAPSPRSASREKAHRIPIFFLRSNRPISGRRYGRFVLFPLPRVGPCRVESAMITAEESERARMVTSEPSGRRGGRGRRRYPRMPPRAAASFLHSQRWSFFSRRSVLALDATTCSTFARRATTAGCSATRSADACRAKRPCAGTAAASWGTRRRRREWLAGVSSRKM